MSYEVNPSQEYPGDWIVSKVLHPPEGDGDILLTIFTGPLAAERAWEYAHRMNMETVKRMPPRNQRISDRVGSRHVSQSPMLQRKEKRSRAY